MTLKPLEVLFQPEAAKLYDFAFWRTDTFLKWRLLKGNSNHPRLLHEAHKKILDAGRIVWDIRSLPTLAICFILE